MYGQVTLFDKEIKKENESKVLGNMKWKDRQIIKEIIQGHGSDINRIYKKKSKSREEVLVEYMERNRDKDKKIKLDLDKLNWNIKPRNLSLTGKSISNRSD